MSIAVFKSSSVYSSKLRKYENALFEKYFVLVDVMKDNHLSPAILEGKAQIFSLVNFRSSFDASNPIKTLSPALPGFISDAIF